MVKIKRRVKKQMKFLLIAILCLIVLTVLIVNMKGQNQLVLKGGKSVQINLEETYVEDGVIYKGKDVTEDVTTKSNIDSSKMGTYEITYTYKTSKGKKINATRKVQVKDLTLPIITLKGGSEVLITKGETFKDPGCEVMDNVDGDITKNVKVTGDVDVDREGDYVITYEIQDKAGNKAVKTRKVTVTTKNPLTMNLKEFTLDGLFPDTILQEKKASDEYMDSIIYAGDSMVLYYDINKLVPNKRLWYKNSIDPKTALNTSLFHLYKDTGKTMVELFKENKPAVSIITLGTNSVAYMNQEVFIENYKKLLEEIKKASPSTKLIVQSIPPVDKRKDTTNSAINNDKINKFNYYIVKMCQELGIKFLNSAGAMKDENGYAKEGYCIDYDGIHPSKSGHTALYEYTKNHAYE